MNHLSSIKTLKNRYFVLRHGKGKHNEEAVILSDPSEGVTDYGLVEEGRKEALRAIREAKERGLLDNSTIIVSSDFLRAKETAEIACAILQAEKVILSPALRERWFGLWEKTHNSNYNKVWEKDAINPDNKDNFVESPREVLKRVTALVSELEKEYSDKKILLVSHGDALQILQTGFQKVLPSLHRSIQHLETGEVRELSLVE